jgi:hypothetical protein
VFIYLAILTFTTVVSSCKYVYFDQPQPVGAKSLKEIPEEFRGSWCDAKKRQDTIIITNNSFMMINHEQYVIHNYQADTTPHYKLIDNKIFFREYEPEGFPYTIKDNDIHYDGRLVEVIALSDNAILRKCRDSYVINLKRGQWWEILNILKKKSGEIDIVYPDYERMKILKEELEYEIVNIVVDSSNRETSSDTVYIHAEWKAKDIEKLFPPDSEEFIYYMLLPDSTFLFIGDGVK